MVSLYARLASLTVGGAEGGRGVVCSDERV